MGCDGLELFCGLELFFCPAFWFRIYPPKEYRGEKKCTQKKVLHIEH
jgi:hypothetical protein